MKSRKKPERESECFAKSAEGMWVRAVLRDDGIELLWQVRTKVSGSNLLIFDANGAVEASTPRERAVYPESMRSAGLIPLDDAFVEFCGVENFSDAVIAVMRHAAYMLACGYGDTPEEIVEWFSDLKEVKFMDGTSYKIISERDEFRGLIGVKGVVYKDEDDVHVLHAMVMEEEFQIPLIDNKILISFIIATVPV
ncbi:MAG: hypothetical protein JW704_09795 [Anaerolineaceae bacterium]|nr:hypothetical protein [Anaerolineaceae bacterium]